jgi:hypothetical protein
MENEATIFNQLKRILNQYINSSISKNEIAQSLFDSGHLIKDHITGEIHTASLKYYLQQLKYFGYVKYRRGTKVEVIKHIPMNITSYGTITKENSNKNVNRTKTTST